MANFPDSPGIGSVFIDSTSGFAYKWTGVVWKSFNAAAGSEQKVLDDISSSFNNSTTTFDLTVSSSPFAPNNAQSLQISLGGVIQEPATDYSISGTTITFTTAPNAGLDFFGIVRTTAVNLDFANDGNVSTKQQFTATESQTTFTVTGGYTVDNLDVYRNGVRLRSSTDFTATNGTTFVLTAPASTGDLLESVAYKVASVVVTQGDFSNLNITGIATVGILTGLTSAQAGVFYGPLTGNVTGDLTGDVTGNADTATSATTATTATNAQGLTGTPNISIGSLTAASGTVSGNLSIGGTLTYQDVTNMDVLGIGTFQQGLQVLANGVDVTGIGTFEDRITYDGSLEQAGGGTVTYAVTVASKDSTHRYNGQGSGNAYVIDNLQAPVITVTPGRTYRFTNDNTGSHPLKFYYEADKTTLYSTGVTFDNSYTEITITDTTPAVLHYQCTSHSLMGNAIFTQSNPIVGAGITLNANGGGVHVTGVVTATTFSGNLSGSNVNVGLTTIKSGEIEVTGIVTATTVKAGAAISITDGAVSATRIHASNINVDNLIATENRFITGAEKITRVNGNTASLVYNTTSSNIAVCTNPSGNITLNVTGIPETSDFDDHAITFTVLSNASAGTAYSCLTVTTNALTQTINWMGGDSQTATAGVTTSSGFTIYSFTGINTVGSASTCANYKVLGTVSGGYF